MRLRRERCNFFNRPLQNSDTCLKFQFFPKFSENGVPPDLNSTLWKNLPRRKTDKLKLSGKFSGAFGSLLFFSTIDATVRNQLHTACAAGNSEHVASDIRPIG